ncbi:MAG: cyanophycin synthetase, partial [Actinomycetota bacterium]
KSKIIKPGKNAVVRDQPDAAMQIIQERVREVGASLLLEDRDYGIDDRRQAVGGQLISIRGLHATYEDVLLSLFGPYAAHAAAAAVAALEAELARPLDDEALREAFAAASSPGRLEIVGRHPLVVIDGAHNPAGAAALVEALEDSFTWDRMLLVLGVSKDKDIPGVVEPLAPLAARVYAAHYEFHDRSAAPEQVAEVALAAGADSVETRSTVAEALTAALAEAGEADLVLVTGSLFTVAEARRALGR